LVESFHRATDSIKSSKDRNSVTVMYELFLETMRVCSNSNGYEYFSITKCP